MAASRAFVVKFFAVLGLQVLADEDPVPPVLN
jgi:hypothetical protein